MPTALQLPLPEGSGGDVSTAAFSAPAVRLFLKLADVWDLPVEQRLVLMGEISKSTYHNWQGGKIGALKRDQLDRISLLLGIQKGLKLVFADDAAGIRWLKSANRDTPFGGTSPLDAAMSGGMLALFTVRRYLDAWRGTK
jgi:Protein of unknown function (DUF2384)